MQILCSKDISISNAKQTTNNECIDNKSTTDNDTDSSESNIDSGYDSEERYQNIDMNKDIIIELDTQTQEVFIDKLHEYYVKTSLSENRNSKILKIYDHLNCIWKNMISAQFDRRDGYKLKSWTIKSFMKYFWRLQKFDNINFDKNYRNDMDDIIFYGSFAHNINTKYSDVDIALPLDSDLIDTFTDDNKRIVYCKILKQFTSLLFVYQKHYHNLKYKFIITPILHCRTPLIKLYEPKSDIHIDISIEKKNTKLITKLIKYYTDFDDRVPVFLISIKHWGKRRSINDGFKRYPNSFGWTLICIKYLQEIKPPILPYIIDEDTWKFEDINSNDNKWNLLELMIGFFDYCHKLRWKYLGINVLSREYYTKRNLNDNWNKMYVIEPFSDNINICSGVDEYRLECILTECYRGYIVCKNGADYDYLTQKYNTIYDASEPFFKKFKPNCAEDIKLYEYYGYNQESRSDIEIKFDSDNMDVNCNNNNDSSSNWSTTDDDVNLISSNNDNDIKNDTEIDHITSSSSVDDKK